jgi:hypothetical protein
MGLFSGESNKISTFILHVDLQLICYIENFLNLCLPRDRESAIEFPHLGFKYRYCRIWPADKIHSLYSNFLRIWMQIFFC